MDAEEVFGQNGLLAHTLTNYETRPQQIEMFRAVAEAFSKSHHLMIEAGTGVGKTFAYLVPAIEYARSAVAGGAAEDEPRPQGRETPPLVVSPYRVNSANLKVSLATRFATLTTSKTPVIISTHTINLQEQIFYKDIPTLKSALKIEFKPALAKGRSNYLCRRRLARATNYQTEMFETALEVEELSRLKEWTEETEDGSLSDLPYLPKGEVWSAVCCERDNCAGKKCGYYQNCFYYRARARLWGADLIVVNHALLLLDAVLREEETSLLPNYEAVVIDEAHRLESVARSHLGLEITSGLVKYLMDSIYNPRTNRGLLSFIPPRIEGLRACKQSVLAARECAEVFFERVIDWFSKDAPENGRVKTKSFVVNLLSAALSKLHFDLKEIKEALGRKKYKTPGKKWDEIELVAFVNRTATLAMELDSFVNQSEEDNVYWVEVKRGKRARPFVLLKSAPVEVAEQLKSLLFDRLKSAILTSATLATSPSSLNGIPSEGRDSAAASRAQGRSAGSPPSLPRGLSYLKGVMGLTDAREVILGSPFDYKRQVKLYLNRDLPDPNDKDSFIPMVSDRILKYLDLSKGRAFVLFTSYDLMNRVYERLYPEMERRGMTSYLQGRELPRHKMLEEFKSRVGSVIFGADSFWQGVDVPGVALENVIITKLPFPVPSEPMTEARIERMERAGVDSFMNYFIPEAIIKLRQGFGRLIRTKTDKGIVVILDNRVLTKQYGRLFIEALPTCETIVAD